jgi:hypothetical protein
MDIGQDRGASLDPLPHSYPNVRMARQQHVHPGAKFDQANALAALHKITYLKAEDNAAREQTGDLFEGDIELVALHGYQVLFVLFR